MARRGTGGAGFGGLTVDDAARWATVVGWVSLAFGLFLTTAPRRGAALMGFGDRPRLGRAVGVGDVAIGAGLLLDHDRARWLETRALGNVAIAGLCGWALAAGTPRPGRAGALLALMAGLTPVDGLVARRLRSATTDRAPGT